MNKSKSSAWNICAGFTCLALLMFATGVEAASPAINVLGVNAPTPGASDQYQINSPSFAQSPPPGGGAFNYYLNADPAPGQTFTTGSNPTGYILNSLALYDADDTGGGFGNEAFTLNIYTVTGETNAALSASYVSQSILLPDFNWFQWTNLGAVLQPNTQYAYAMYANGAGWMNLGNISGNLYSGGQVAIVPRAGGVMSFSTTSGWNASFDVGLVPITSVTVSQPTFAPYSIVLPGTTITASASVSGPTPYTYQWQTDGGAGGALTNIPTATSSNLVINTTGYALGNYQYDLVVSDNTSTATSQVANLIVQRPAAISGVIGIKFGFASGYATSDVPFPADDAGVASGQLVPPSYQPLVAVGNWNNLMANVLPPQDNNAKAAAIDQTWNITTDTAGNTLSGVTLTPGGFNDGWFSGGTECADGRLLYDCWKFNTGNGQADGGGRNYATLTISGLPGNTYDVYLYVNDNNGNYWGNAQANSVVAVGTDVDNNDGFNGASSDPCDVTPSLHTAGGFGNPANYVRMPFVAASGDAITINVVMQGGGDFGVSGIELVPSSDLTLAQDTLPTYAETVVGDQVVFSAAFSDSPAVNLQWIQIAGAVTNTITTGVQNVTSNGVVTSTLTISNAQVSNSGSYQLKATSAANSADYSFSSAAQLVVSNAPAPVNGIVVNYAAQTGAAPFYPAWTVNTGSDLVYGFVDGDGSPGTVLAGAGNFGQDSSVGDPAILSDGLLGDAKSAMDTCGTGGVGASVTYTLVTNSAPDGFELTNIQIYGGWTDAGRRDQEYQVLYATVTAPTLFIPLLTTHYLPANPSGSAEATRTSLLATNGVLAHNVCSVEINWNVTPQYLNGYAGYSEIVIGGTNSTRITGLIPILIQDVVPQTASDEVGGDVVMTASFTNATTVQWEQNGTNVNSGVVTVTTNGLEISTLTLNHLQLGNAGNYYLVASNSVGITTTSTNTVTVNPAATPVNNVIVSTASQTEGNALIFIPTWDSSALASNLLYSVAPSSSGSGDFTGAFDGTGDGASQPSILTDGSFGQIDFKSTGTHGSLSLIGSSTQSGNFVAYTLPGSANGYTITNITTYGGWNDSGRDGQAYTVSYSTVANPTNFIELAVVNYLPANPNANYCMTRATVTAANGILASNVAGLYFNFATPNSPGGENGFEGYSEISAFGRPSAPLVITPRIGSIVRSGANLVVTGTGGYPPNSGYTWLSTTNLTPPVKWITNSTGTLDVNGAFTNTAPISPSQPQMFFQLRIP